MTWLSKPTGAITKASLYRAIVTAYGPEPEWSIHDQNEVWVELSGGPNRIASWYDVCSITYTFCNKLLSRLEPMTMLTKQQPYQLLQNPAYNLQNKEETVNYIHLAFSNGCSIRPLGNNYL